MERWWGWAVSAAFVGAVLYPLQTDPPTDSFPLSTYPMFTSKRPPHADVDHVVAIAGERSEVVPPALVYSSEVLQTQQSVKKTIRRGRRAAKKLCSDVAARVAEESDLSWATHIEVRGDRYMVLGYFSSARQPIRSRKHARCEVKR